MSVDKQSYWSLEYCANMTNRFYASAQLAPYRRLHGLMDTQPIQEQPSPSADQGNTHRSDAHLLAGKSPNTGIDLYNDGYVDPVYQAKARILNRSIQDIGMGKYQVLVIHVTRLRLHVHLGLVFAVVVSLRSGRFWMVCVSLRPWASSRYSPFVDCPLSNIKGTAFGL